MTFQTVSKHNGLQHCGEGEGPLALPPVRARRLGQFCFGDLVQKCVNIQPALTDSFGFIAMTGLCYSGASFRRLCHLSLQSDANGGDRKPSKCLCYLVPPMQ